MSLHWFSASEDCEGVDKVRFCLFVVFCILEQIHSNYWSSKMPFKNTVKQAFKNVVKASL